MGGCEPPLHTHPQGSEAEFDTPDTCSRTAPSPIELPLCLESLERSAPRSVEAGDRFTILEPLSHAYAGDIPDGHAASLWPTQSRPKYTHRRPPMPKPSPVIQALVHQQPMVMLTRAMNPKPQSPPTQPLPLHSAAPLAQLDRAPVS